MPTCWPGWGMRDTQQQSWHSTEDRALAPRQCRACRLPQAEGRAWAEHVGSTGAGVWGRKGSCFLGGLVTLEVLHL